MDTAHTLELDRQEWYRRLKYTPRASQQLMENALDAGHRYVSYFAFPRAGKSYGAAKYASLDLLKLDWHIWIVAPTYPLGSKEFGYIWDDMLDQGYLEWADPKHGGSRANDPRSGHMFIKFPWRAFVQVVSADNPSSLRAEEFDTLVLAEASALNPDIFHRHLYTRAEKRQAKVIIPTTPMGKNWIYDTFRVPSRKTDSNGAPNPRYNPLYWSCVVSADPELVDPADWDMPDTFQPGVYTLEAVAEGKLQLPPPIYLEQFGGGFASYAGRVLPYDPRNHRIKPFKIPDHWTHIVGWDHGSSPSKTAILVGSYDPNGILYWWAELYTTGWTIRQYWEWVKDTLGPNKAVSLVAVDPSAKQVRTELANIRSTEHNLGVATNIPHDKQIEAGVIRLTQLLNLRQMYFFEGCCTNWEREANRMEWDEKNPKKILQDHLYHAISATRYATLITVRYPEEPTGPDITADPATSRREYLKQIEKLIAAKNWKRWEEKMKRDQDVDRYDKLDDILNADILDEETFGFVDEGFDVESYFDD